MNIGRALLVQSGINHTRNGNYKQDTILDTLYTRLQWAIAYKGIFHADTVRLSEQYTDYLDSYMKGGK
jgi:hypothetical protein